MLILMSSSEVTSTISSDHGDTSTEDHDRSNKIIDPGDFNTYEDYVDAYICSEDIRYLQVKGDLSLLNFTLISMSSDSLMRVTISPS